MHAEDTLATSAQGCVGHAPAVQPRERRTIAAVCVFAACSDAAIAAIRTLAVTVFGWFLGLSPVVAAESDGPSRPVDTVPAEHALAALRSVWISELDGLTGAARSLATAGDTYEFVARPNLPYVHGNFGQRQLSAGRIDTALIINREGSPLFWRRREGRPNRGFADAAAFLAQLPPLAHARASDGPTVAGAVQLAQGAALVVAMPITRTVGSKASRGWLILARELDAAQWRRYTEAAQVTADVVDHGGWPSELEPALARPLEPVVRADDTQLLGYMAVPDHQGKPFRAFRVKFPLPPVPRQASTPSPSRYIGLGLPLVAAIACAAGTTAVLRRRRSRPVERAQPTALLADAPTGEPPDAAPTAPIPAATDSATDCAPPSVACGEAVADSGDASSCAAPATATTLLRPGQGPARHERLRAALAAIDTVFRYQPQVDLHTGRVAGVEALAFLRGTTDDRSSTALVAQLEGAGLGLTLAERRLQDICAERRLWRRQIGDDFPIGLPVSQRTLEDPGFLPLIWSTLAAYELPARFLELEVLETVLEGSASATRALVEASEAGVLIAVDRFNGERSNLRALARLPISKVRVDFALAGDPKVGTRADKLFDAIVGAARGLGIITCATGIDSPELLTAAEYRGCRMAQGAAVGPPSDGETFLALVRGSGVETASLPVLRFDERRFRAPAAEVA